MADALKPATQTDIDAYVATFRDKMCWQAGKCLGSMLYLDFGEKITLPGRRGEITKGELRIGIYDCYWELSNSSTYVCSEDDLSEFSRRYETLFLGSTLKIIEVIYSDLRFEFSNGTMLKVDMIDQRENDYSLLEVNNRSGIYLTLTPNGQLVLTD